MTARPLLHVLLVFLSFGFITSCAQRPSAAQVRDPASSSTAHKAEESRATEDFRKRVQAYAEVERKLESRLPKLPEKAEPERIVAHKDALASAIQQTRSSAKQGDLFIPEVRPVLINMVRSETVGAQGARAREEIVDTAARKGSNEAPAAVNLKVNSKYPSSVSLSTVPADLLTKLPQLPSEVDYRFVDRHLILRSVKANLILDFIPGALPPPAKRKQ